MEQTSVAPEPESDYPFIGRPEDPLDPQVVKYLQQFEMLPLLDPYLEAHNRLQVRDATRSSSGRNVYGYYLNDAYRREFQRLVDLVIAENKLRSDMNALRRDTPDWP